MIAASLNVGGGVRLIKPAKLYMTTQKHYKHNEDGRMTPGVRSHGSVSLSHSGNVVTRTGLQQQLFQYLTVIYCTQTSVIFYDTESSPGY